VEADGPGGLDIELLSEARFVDHVLEDAVCGWGPADITHTEEEDAFHK
jgi:hypothetical protein